MNRILKIFIGLVYLILAFILITAFDHKMGGAVPSFMARDELLPTGVFARQLLNPLQDGKPLDFRALNFNPKGPLKLVIGVNPNCFPGVPSNTLDVWLSPQRYPDYQPQFQYLDLQKFDRIERYKQFFEKLPCNEGAKIYMGRIAPKYNATWTFFQSFQLVDDQLSIINYRQDGSPIPDYGKLGWVYSGFFIFVLFFLNRKFCHTRKYFEYPNYFLILWFTMSVSAIFQSWEYWTFGN